MSHSLRNLLLAGCGLGGAVHAQTLVRSVPGPAAGAQFGKACIAIPDQNGDAVKDLLVGAPEFNGARGAIYCISGRFLATGTGVQTLWSLVPSANAGDRFGTALADVGDVTGDGVHDFLVGQPGYDHGTVQNSGAVRLVHGSVHSIVSLVHASAAGGLGSAIAACGDVNSNGFADVAIAAPFVSTAKGEVRIVDGLALTQPTNVGNVTLAAFVGDTLDFLGSSIASGADFNGDGIAEIVAGAPGHDSTGAADAGQVVVFDPIQGFSIRIDSFVAGEAFGASVAVGDDHDGDGVADIIVGAPNSSNGSAFEVGRVVVLSGARVGAQTPPYEILSFAYGSVTPPINHADPQPNFHFGAAVHAGDDLTGDGVGEIVVGAPGYFTASIPSGWSFRGLVRVFSGATGVQLASITGSSTDRLGDSLGGALDDLDGDGLDEFVLAGSLSDAGGADSGVVKCYRLLPLAPVAYCAGKVNSLGCTPSIGSSGSPSASSGQPFLITASNVINQKNGLLFYGHAPASTPFQGGAKCVANPTLRTPPQSSGGASSGSSCSGAFSFDFNAWFASGADPSSFPGSEIFAQYWSRDPASPSSTSLSNALRFLIHP
jgi:hypothetical protein